MKAIITALLVGLSLHLPARATPGEVLVGALLRATPMQGLLGPSKLLSDFRGKPLLINVWASWCGPCQSEIGSVERLARRYGGKQFHVIGISTDDYPDRAMGFLQRFGVSFPNFIDHQLVLENMLGADHLPLTLLVDAKGRVLGKYYGAKEWDDAPALRLIAKTLNVRL